ncbi:hypothetical protein PG2022B_1558 [Bifidobacterium animalis subsp. animalis]|nr:hypothetical protein PG2022B_1558 [Bifidobacterium animalis subsp. animalis]
MRCMSRSPRPDGLLGRYAEGDTGEPVSPSAYRPNSHADALACRQSGTNCIMSCYSWEPHPHNDDAEDLPGREICLVLEAAVRAARQAVMTVHECRAAIGHRHPVPVVGLRGTRVEVWAVDFPMTTFSQGRGLPCPASIWEICSGMAWARQANAGAGNEPNNEGMDASTAIPGTNTAISPRKGRSVHPAQAWAAINPSPYREEARR